MSPQTHTILCNFYMVVSSILVLPFFCASTSDFHVAIGLMLAYGLSNIMVMMWLPVRCLDPACGGRMRRQYSRLSFFETNVHYTCKTCGQACDHVIYFPDITVEASG